jgi:hypothetical protein
MTPGPATQPPRLSPTPKPTPAPTPTLTQAPAAPNGWTDFTSEVVRTTDAMGQIAQQYSASTSLAALADWADAQDAGLTEALGWLEEHPPASCYQAAWTAWRKELLFLGNGPPLLRSIADGSMAPAEGMAALQSLRQEGQAYATKADTALKSVERDCR